MDAEVGDRGPRCQGAPPGLGPPHPRASQGPPPPPRDLGASSPPVVAGLPTGLTADEVAVAPPAFPQVPAKPRQARHGPGALTWGTWPRRLHVSPRLPKAPCTHFSNTFVHHLIKAH